MKMNNEEWDYIIDGRQGGLLSIIVTVVPMAFFIALAVDQFQPSPNKLIFLAFMATAAALFLLSSLVRLVIRYFFFRVYIGKKGFWFQSNPFDGEYYEYQRIRSCKEEITLHRGAERHFFSFTVKGGETKRFALGIQNNYYAHEIAKLEKRIHKANSL